MVRDLAPAELQQLRRAAQPLARARGARPPHHAPCASAIPAPVLQAARGRRPSCDSSPGTTCTNSGVLPGRCSRHLPGPEHGVSRVLGGGACASCLPAAAATAPHRHRPTALCTCLQQVCVLEGAQHAGHAHELELWGTTLRGIREQIRQGGRWRACCSDGRTRRLQLRPAGSGSLAACS